MLLVLVSGSFPILLFIDETLERRRGAKIKAKGYYRDAVRSSKSQVVKAFGLKWLAMALSVRLPFMPWKEVKIVGYSGVKRLVRFVSNTCMCGADGSTPIPIRWVLVVDPTGKMDPMPLMSTDPLLTPEQIIELYVDRWSLEVTFEETREHLGVETQRQWSDKAIARSTPVLMGLYSLVCLMGNRLGQEELLKIEETAWYRKERATFSDMLRAVRMTIWRENLILRKAKMTPSVENITPEMAEWAAAIVEQML